MVCASSMASEARPRVRLRSLPALSPDSIAFLASSSSADALLSVAFASSSAWLALSSAPCASSWADCAPCSSVRKTSASSSASSMMLRWSPILSPPVSMSIWYWRICSNSPRASPLVISLMSESTLTSSSSRAKTPFLPSVIFPPMPSISSR